MKRHLTIGGLVNASIQLVLYGRLFPPLKDHIMLMLMLLYYINKRYKITIKYTATLFLMTWETKSSSVHQIDVYQRK